MIESFKTVQQRRSCMECQSGNHGSCGYLVEFEEINRGAVDAEDFIPVNRWCICYNASTEMHMDKRETLLAEASFVERTMQDFLPSAPVALDDGCDLASLTAGGVLSDSAIHEAMKEGHLDIEPFHDANLGPASYDLSLHPVIGEVRFPRVIDLANIGGPHMVELNMQPGGFEDGDYDLLPGEMILASTIETVRLETCLAARVEGKSSLARLGLMVHVTGGFIDPGFEGQITLEMVNLSGSIVRLHPGILIAQIAFMPVVGKVRRSYAITGRYQNQQGPTGSLYTP